jgi:hypothetical protein
MHISHQHPVCCCCPRGHAQYYQWYRDACCHALLQHVDATTLITQSRMHACILTLGDKHFDLTVSNACIIAAGRWVSTSYACCATDVLLVWGCICFYSALSRQASMAFANIIWRSHGRPLQLLPWCTQPLLLLQVWRWASEIKVHVLVHVHVYVHVCTEKYMCIP